MLNPIEPVGPGSVGQTHYISLRSSETTDMFRADTTRGAAQGSSASPAADSSMLIPLQEFLSGLLEGLGLDPNNDKTLQILITLMILLALLESLEGNGSQQGQGQAADLGVEGGGSTYIGYASSSTISIEYSETIISFGDANTVREAFGAEGASSEGSSLDVSA